MFPQYKCFVGFHSSYEDVDYVYIAMEYIPIGDMSKTFADGYQWNESDTKTVIKQLLQGLAVMHKEGITHRDLKPEVCTPTHPQHKPELISPRIYSSLSPRMRPKPSM